MKIHIEKDIEVPEGFYCDGCSYIIDIKWSSMKTVEICCRLEGNEELCQTDDGKLIKTNPAY